jgi:hypothetical protein
METTTQEKTKPTEMHIEVHCECGKTYTITPDNYIICPYCHRPPLLLWNYYQKAHKFAGVCDRTVYIKEDKKEVTPT